MVLFHGLFCLLIWLPLVSQQPQIILLKEGTDTSQGKAQLISNINACVAVVDAVRTTLGPRGMDKLVHDDKGTTTISNDGATIMRLLEIVHPAAKTLVDIARSQDSEVRSARWLTNRHFVAELSARFTSNPKYGLMQIAKLSGSSSLRNLLEASFCLNAPTSCGVEPWHYTTVRRLRLFCFASCIVLL